MPQLSDFTTEAGPRVPTEPPSISSATSLPGDKPAPDGASEPASLSDFATEAAPAPTVGERAAAAGQGAVAGVAQAAPVVAGAFMGAKLGAAGGAFGGPLAPFTVPAGAVAGGLVGAGAGLLAGGFLQQGLAGVQIPGTDETLTFESMESVPPSLRPYAVAGETFGASLPFMAVPYMAVRDGIRFTPNLAGRFFNRIIEGAARAPATFAAAELSAATGAAIGGGIAEAVFPGELGPRMGAELVGGIVNPGRWVVTIARGSYSRARQVIMSFSPAARENKAAQIIQDIVREAGEDPIELAARLRQAQTEFPELAVTAGQSVDSPALLAIEAKLTRESAKFGGESREMAKAGLESLRTMIRALETTGNPAALREAAQVRQDYFQALLATRLHIAEQKALEAAAQIDPSRPLSRAEFGRNVGEVMREAMSDVRAVERELWGKIDKTVPARTDSILERHAALTAERLEEEALPKVADGFVARMRRGIDDAVESAVAEATEKGLGKRAIAKAAKEAADNFAPTDAGELIRFRSRMLALSREAAAKNEWSDARVFGELAEAALDDLDTLYGAPSEGVLRTLGTAPEAYSAARAWSRELHDTFSRTFAGEALERAQSGAPRIPPEFLMQRAFGTGREMGELQFRQLEEAARMAGIEHVSRLIDVQERTIRFAASEIIDTVTGRVNPNRLSTFIRNNGELLGRFPEIKAQLKSAESAERFLKATEAGGRKAQRAIEGQAAFSKVLKGEDPALAVGKALRGGNPTRDFAQLAKLARRGGTEAVEGLKASIFAHAYKQASSRTGGFSFTAYSRIFDEPLTTGGPNLKAMMLKSKLGTLKDFELFGRFLDRAAGIEAALANRTALDKVLSQEDALFDLVLRISGARAGALAPTGGAHGLIVGGAGSRFARQVFDKIPKVHIKTVLTEASQNPEMMAALLERPTTQADKIRFALQMNAFLWQIGVFEVLPAVRDFGSQKLQEFVE